jgi:4-hydroxy-L-threonine phosphate dehydrogenase PdxA
VASGAGESERLGDEERLAIIPGVRQARRRLRNKAQLVGPVGAESAYRLAHTGTYDGVVAMYHDQATIPTKLVAFGDAVNVTLGSSRVRTSVDRHGLRQSPGKARPTPAACSVLFGSPLFGSSTALDPLRVSL